MSEDPKILNQHDMENCPDQHLLSDYILGKLNERESKDFLNHLAGCEFCQDAVAGYAMAQGMDQIPLIMDELHKQIDDRVDESATRTPFYRNNFFRVAAILIVLAIGVVVLSNLIKSPDSDIAEAVVEESLHKNDDKEISGNKRKKESKSKPVDEKQIAQFDAEKISIENDLADPNDIEMEVPILEEMDIAELKERVELSSEETNSSGLFAPESIDETPAKDKEESFGYTVSETSKGIFNKQANSKSEKKAVQTTGKYDIEGYSDIPVDSIAISHDFFVDGINYFNTGDFNNSGYFLANAYSWDSTNIEAACLSGISNYNIKNYALAVSYFNEVLSQKNDPCFYQAKWFKAQSLVKLNKSEEAKSLLESLSNKSNPYQKEAQSLLETIK